MASLAQPREAVLTAAQAVPRGAARSGQGVHDSHAECT